MTIANGTTVTVRHDLGSERGTVIGAIRALPNERPMYTVRFADRTVSVWPAARVTA